MKKNAFLFVLCLILFLAFLPSAYAEENSEQDGPEGKKEQYNELGIKEGTEVYGEDISELSEEELKYIPEGWRDGEFESEHPESEAEPETQASLNAIYPDVNNYIKSMLPATIEYQHINHLTKFNYRGGYGAVEGVVAHETANDSSTITGEISWMKRNHRNAFVHAFIDHNRIIETHPLNYGAWGAGRYANQRFVHVELVHTHRFHDFAKSINNYADYIAGVLFQYDLGVTNAEASGRGTLWSHKAVTKHLGGTTHTDPHGYFGKWGYNWYEFTQLVEQKYAALNKVDRISGQNRYQTAVEVSKEGWKSASTVVLARGDEYADALAGVPLAKKFNAPLLLTQSNTFTEATMNEIRRLGAKTVYLLGGKKAISSSVESELSKLGVTVHRMEGANRVETAASIAEEIWKNGKNKAVLVNGYNFPDALSVASYAAQKGIPILLTETNKLPDLTKEVLKDKQTLVIGGSLAVSNKVFNQIPNRERLAGQNRFDTAVEIANHFNTGADHQYITTGYDFPDALASGALAAKEGTGVLLVGTSIPKEVKEFITTNKIEEVSIVGGSIGVPDKVQRLLSDILY